MPEQERRHHTVPYVPMLVGSAEPPQWMESVLPGFCDVQRIEVPGYGVQYVEISHEGAAVAVTFRCYQSWNHTFEEGETGSGSGAHLMLNPHFQSMVQFRCEVAPGIKMKMRLLLSNRAYPLAGGCHDVGEVAALARLVRKPIDPEDAWQLDEARRWLAEMMAGAIARGESIEALGRRFDRKIEKLRAVPAETERFLECDSVDASPLSPEERLVVAGVFGVALKDCRDRNFRGLTMERVDRRLRTARPMGVPQVLRELGLGWIAAKAATAPS